MKTLQNLEGGYMHLCSWHRNIQDIGNITHFKKTTEDFLKTPTRKILRNITCVLVDRSHHYEDILIDINLLKKIPNKKKKLIVFDDLGIPDVSRGVDEFRAEFKDRNIIEFEPSQFYIDE